jgi:hypothetical protein
MVRVADPITDDLIASWWEYWRRARGSRDERKALSVGEPVEVCAAHELVEQRIDLGGAQAVDLLAALADAAPAGDNGTTVGAGPLETLLHEHGDSVIDEVERTARRSTSFADALAQVWLERGLLSLLTERRLAIWVPSLASPH